MRLTLGECVVRRIGGPTTADSRLRGCRVVTTSMTARLLLGNQLRSIHDVSWTIVTGDPFDDAPPDVEVKVIPIRREFAFSDLAAFFRLWSCFRRARFDFVQTHTPKASFLGLPAARLSGTRSIYTIHGALYFRDNAPWANALGWLFERWCCAWASHVLVQSREDQRVLPRALICPARKIAFVGNGVLVDRFVEDVPPARHSPQPIVLMVSRLVLEKGCADFVEMATALEGEAEFVHVGPEETDQRDALSESAISAARRYVSFVGPVADVRPYLASAAIVVLPSYREGIPRVPMEAAAAGRPVVAYDVRGVREVVDDTTGRLVPRGDVEALVRSVRELLEDPEHCAALGRAARERVVASFGEEDVIARLRDSYAALGPRA